MSTVTIGILTVSDRASRGDYVDEGGPAIREYLNEVLTHAWTPLEKIVPDDSQTIADTIRSMATAGSCLIITTGGTGPSPRDVTPEATEMVCTHACYRVLENVCDKYRSSMFQPRSSLDKQPASVNAPS